MVTFYLLEPEVAGGLGPETDMDTSQHPPVIRKLNYEFSDWLGDSILESFPVFIVTEELANKLSQHNLTGFELDEVKISTDLQFKEREKFRKSNINLPEFKWLKIVGREKKDDFSISQNKLAVSENALQVLKSSELNHCDIVAVD